MITIKQLRYFDALARHHHFGKAAKSCAISQPALSLQIRDLERQLGINLVERRPNDVCLTSDGEEIARRAGNILAEIRDLMDYGHHAAGVMSGPLRLGIIPSIAPYLLPRMLSRLNEAYPDIDLKLRETLTATLIDELRHGDLDAVIAALPADTPETESLGLFEDRFLLATHARPDLDERKRVKPEAIADENLMLLEEGHCLRDQALTYCANLHGRSGRTSDFGATSLTTVMQMVAAGYGVTLLPEMCTDVEVRDERIALLRFTEPQPSRTIGLLWRKTSPRKQDFAALGGLIAEVAEELSGSRAMSPAPEMAG